MANNIKDIIQNKKAKFNYEILDTIEAGIVLKGTEVKSIRKGKVSIQEAYARIKNNEAFIYGMNIAPYESGNLFNHEPDRVRKLLLHKQEIKRLLGKQKEKGLTLVPLKLYWKNGKVKVLIGIAKGKTKYDKRQTLKQKDIDRELQRYKNIRY